MIYDSNIQRKEGGKVTFCLVEEALFDMQCNLKETGYKIYQVVTRGELAPLSDRVGSTQDLAFQISKSAKVSINHGDTVTTIPAPELKADNHLNITADVPVRWTYILRFMADCLKYKK